MFVDPSYLAGNCGRVMVNGREFGTLGLLHPDVMKAFSLNYPAAALSLNVQDLLGLNQQPF